MRSGKERIASIADSTVLIKVGIGVPRVRTGLRKCVAIVAMVKTSASLHLYSSVPGLDGQVDAKERFRVVLYIIWWSEVRDLLYSSSEDTGINLSRGVYTPQKMEVVRARSGATADGLLGAAC